jgi:hypothetical protein
VFPAASCAVTVSTFDPGCSAIPDADQLVVPVAVPLPPALLLHVTCVTPMLSAAVPPSVSGLLVAVYVAPDVGVVMLTVGGVVSTAAWKATICMTQKAGPEPVSGVEALYEPVADTRRSSTMSPSG